MYVLFFLYELLSLSLFLYHVHVSSVRDTYAPFIYEKIQQVKICKLTIAICASDLRFDHMLHPYHNMWHYRGKNIIKDDTQHRVSCRHSRNSCKLCNILTAYTRIACDIYYARETKKHVDTELQIVYYKYISLFNISVKYTNNMTYSIKKLVSTDIFPGGTNAGFNDLLNKENYTQNSLCCWSLCIKIYINKTAYIL